MLYARCRSVESVLDLGITTGLKSMAGEVAVELASALNLPLHVVRREALETKRKEHGRELQPSCRRGEEGTTPQLHR